jgi:GNAT superfamily N-acetyltransferase
LPDRHYAREFFDRWDEISCPVCNLCYAEGEPEDERIHLRCHRAVINVFEPKPYPRIAKLYANHGRFIPVTMISALALRRRVFRMGRAFMREFGSMMQYDESNDPAQAFIIADEAGRSIGTYVVRWQESDDPTGWVLMWIWIAPAFRRQGLLRAAWEHARKRFPDIRPEAPFSDGAAAFFAKLEEVRPEIRAYAQRQLDAGPRRYR